MIAGNHGVRARAFSFCSDPYFLSIANQNHKCEKAMMPLRLNAVILVAITAIALTACASTKKSPEDKAQTAFDEVRMSVQTVVSDADRAEDLARLNVTPDFDTAAAKPFLYLKVNRLAR